MYGGLGQREQQMLISEVGALLASTATDLARARQAAESIGDTSLVRTAESIQQDWILAQKTALDYQDYRSARRTLGFIQDSINRLIGRLREKGVPIQPRGILGGSLPGGGDIFETLRQTAGAAAFELGGLPSWALPVAAGLVLFLLIRR